MKKLLRLCLHLSFLCFLAACQMSLFYQTLGDKIVTHPLSIVPPSVATLPSGVVTFIASGGTPPYTFSVAAVGTAPPLPTINSTTGAYVAGSSLGTDTIQVTDATSAKAIATVTVTAAVTNVDYTVTGAGFPTTGTEGLPITAGLYNFTIQNIGVAQGTKPVTWWAFMSPTSTLGSGATMLESGSSGALGPGATANVGVSWTWPSVSGTNYLFVVLTADDDLNQSNNTFGPQTVTLAVSQVDYTVTSVVGPGGTASQGSAVSGTFQFSNIGTNNGTQNVGWAVFASNTLGGSETLVTSGITSLLNAAATSLAIPFVGFWPSVSGYYYLIARVSSPEDVNLANDSGVSASQTAVGLDEAPSGLHNSVTTAFNLGITLQPGMTFSLTGSLLSTESDDFIGFNTGTANSVTFYMVWTGSQTVNFFVVDSLNNAKGTMFGTPGSSFTWTWPVDTGGGVPRWLRIQNPLLQNIGAYTLLIHAN